MQISNKKILTTAVTILSIVGYGAFVFAAQLPNGTLPPIGGYVASDSILDPGCAPGATDCFKNIGAGWSLTGDAGTDGGTTNFIGTTDAVDFVVKANNKEIARFGPNGNVAVGSPNTLYGAAGPVASGDFSFALGYDTVASGLGSFAGGYGAVSSRENSFAWGSFTTASGDGAVAFGQGTVASGLNAVALNEQTTAAGARSFATGDKTQANAPAASSFGQNTRANGELSFVQGRNTVASSFVETVFGISNTLYTPFSTASFDGADRLFTIGNGNGSGNESDAFTILKNGKTGIGYDNFETTTSNALLQVNGGILSSGLTNCQIISTDTDGLMSCGTASSLIGSTSGVSSAPTAGLSTETWVGDQAGSSSASKEYTIFLGVQSGAGATSASHSIFLGGNAGYHAANATHAIFIGDQAGYNDTVNNTVGGASILIGDNTSTGGFSNSIALGRSAVNTGANQFMIGSSSSPIDTTRINGSAATQCTITTGTGIACTSDERVKTNIADLTSTTLDTLLNVRTVTYNWLANPTSRQQVGFLAQDLERYFPDLVETDKDGMKSVYYAQMTPILVEAVRELNLKIDTVASLGNSALKQSLAAWLGDVGNGIATIYSQVSKSQKVETNELCVGSVCVTSEQFLHLVEQAGATTAAPNLGQLPEPEVSPTPETSTDTTTGEITPPAEETPASPADGEQETTSTPEAAPAPSGDTL